MIYLEVATQELDEWPYWSNQIYHSDWYWHYPLLPEGEALLDLWANTKAADDALVSGIFADWLTEHKDELLDGSAGPSDPAVRLDALIDYLRARFHSSC